MDTPRVGEKRLDTWKSIAQYLGRSSRTVQRWHISYGLPVRHLGSGCTSVFAYADELDKWLRERKPEIVRDTRAGGEPLVEERKSADTAAPAGASYQTFELRVTSRDAERSADLFSRADKMCESLSESNLNAIAGLYRELIDLEPWNAKAFACLALALIAEGVLCRVHPNEAFLPAQAALRRAQELDRNLFETRCASAWIKMLIERDWQGAEVAFNELVEERPTSPRPLVGLVLVRIAQGDLSGATSMLRGVSRYTPLSAGAAALFCWVEYLAGDFENAIRHVAQEHDIGHRGAVLDATEALANVLLLGPAAVLEHLELLATSAPRSFAMLGVLGYAYAMNGEQSRARQVLKCMTESGLRSQHHYSYSIALTHLGLEENEKAVEWLEASYRQGSLWSLGFKWDPLLAPLRGDPNCNSRLEQLSYPFPNAAIR
jgi:hypothetical protein